MILLKERKINLVSIAYLLPWSLKFCFFVLQSAFRDNIEEVIERMATTMVKHRRRVLRLTRKKEK